jgi:carboxylesterase type B
VVTDYWFRCASEVFLRNSGPSSRLFAYRFDHLYSNASIFPTFGLPEICATVVCHASELPFVFHNVPSFASFTPAEDVLANAMAAAWTNFAKSGDPNGPGAPAWPAWTLSARKTLVWNESVAVEDTTRLCGVWDSIGGYFA